MSRRYLIALGGFTLLMVVASLLLKATSPAIYLPLMPFMALYFGVVCALQHWLIVRALRQSPRQFVQTFLGTVVGTLLLHLIVLSAYLFTHPQTARPFLIAFCIGYALALVFETSALVILVRDERKKH